MASRCRLGSAREVDLRSNSVLGKACGLEESNFVQSDSAPGAAWTQRAQIMALRVCAAASFSLRRLSRAARFETRSAPRIRPCNERMAASARAKAAVASCESLPLFPFKVEKTEDFFLLRKVLPSCAMHYRESS